LLGGGGEREKIEGLNPNCKSLSFRSVQMANAWHGS
jgi:hypothetical protein